MNRKKIEEQKQDEGIGTRWWNRNEMKGQEQDGGIEKKDEEIGTR